MVIIFIVCFFVVSKLLKVTKQCICFQCFEGEKCDKPLRDCHLMVTNQQCKACKFWWKDQLNYTTEIPADFQIEYVENSTKPGMTPLLKQSIRKRKKFF